MKAEHGEGWLAQRLADNLASFLRAFPDRAPALKGRDRRLRTTLVVGVKVGPVTCSFNKALYA